MSGAGNRALKEWEWGKEHLRSLFPYVGAVGHLPSLAAHPTHDLVQPNADINAQDSPIEARQIHLPAGESGYGSSYANRMARAV